MSEHQRAIALELTRIHFQTYVSKGASLDEMGRADFIYLQILQSLENGLPQDPNPGICATKVVEQTSPVVTNNDSAMPAANSPEAVPANNAPEFTPPAAA